MTRTLFRSVLIGTLAIVLVATLGSCGGKKKTAPLSPGTTTVDIPPLPEDLATLVYRGDAMFGRDCADVPSGLNNCKEWLRHEAQRNLLALLESSYTEEITGEEGSGSAGTNESGGMAEERQLTVNYVRETVAKVRLRTHESPLLAMPDAKNYALRVLVIQDETDYDIWTEIAERASKDGRPAIAQRYRARLKDRFGDDPPKQRDVEEAERAIARHFRELWDMAQKNAEGM